MIAKSRSALVVGGGVIGLTSAFRLANDGWDVTLFDPSPGSGATWAAAGMLAPYGEIAPGERENFCLQRDATAQWESLSADVEKVCGVETPVTKTGTLIVGFDAGDQRLLQRYNDVAQSYDVAPDVVTRQSHSEFFRGLSHRIDSGLYLDGDSWLDPDRMVANLLNALQQLNVTFIKDVVRSAATSGDGVHVETDSSSFGGFVGVLATGAKGVPQGLERQFKSEVRPVRGMTIRVQGPDRSAQPTVRAFVRGRAFYMVSRPGGYCVLGASSDEDDEMRVEVGELQRLLRDALDIVPELETAAFLETRQGLRPASTSLDPFFEVVERRWAWSSGHYRHGVTLAPLASQRALDFANGLS